jgi:cysteine protease ATG4
MDFPGLSNSSNDPPKVPSSYPPSSNASSPLKADSSWWNAFTRDFVTRVRTISEDLKYLTGISQTNESTSNREGNRKRKLSGVDKSLPEIWLLGSRYIRFVDTSCDTDDTNDCDRQGTVRGPETLSVYEQITKEKMLNASALAASLRGQASSAIAYSRSELFMADFRSRLWLTYRTHYPTLVPSSWTTDIGWGCMLRSGQMLLAQCLILHILGREWRFGFRGDDNIVWKEYLKILKWFIDSPNSACLFSIHHITKLGLEYDLPVGEWYGPSTIAQSLKALVNSNSIGDPTLKCHVAQDATLFKDQIYDLFQQNHSVLLLVPVRLGVENLNPIYHRSILDLFKVPYCVGIAGGKPNSAVYFVGVEKNDLLYLDPHFARHALILKQNDEYSIEELMTYHCDTVRKINVSTLDPSLLLGFYCKTLDDFEDLLKHWKKVTLFKVSGAHC